MNTALAFRVLDVLKAVNAARENVTKEYETKVMSEVAVLDNGKPVPDGDSPTGFKLLVSPDRYEEVTKSFGEKIAEINVNKLAQKTIEQVAKDFSPVELLALEPIYTKLEIVSDGDTVA